MVTNNYGTIGRNDKQTEIIDRISALVEGGSEERDWIHPISILLSRINYLLTIHPWKIPVYYMMTVNYNRDKVAIFFGPLGIKSNNRWELGDDDETGGVCCIEHEIIDIWRLL